MCSLTSNSYIIISLEFLSGFGGPNKEEIIINIVMLNCLKLQISQLTLPSVFYEGIYQFIIVTWYSMRSCDRLNMQSQQLLYFFQQNNNIYRTAKQMEFVRQYSLRSKMQVVLTFLDSVFYASRNSICLELQIHSKIYFFRNEARPQFHSDTRNYRVKVFQRQA